MGGAKITVIGVGGGGGNAVSTLARIGAAQVETLAANTDEQALRINDADQKLTIGFELTDGLGCGADPDLGRQAAEESKQELLEALADSDLVFITAGMGGGTGTGASPVVAELARSVGALTVAVVTRPFAFEGEGRRARAEEGIRQLLPKVDALIVVSNERLLETCSENISYLDAFAEADRVLSDAVMGIAGLVHEVGYVNADFNDLRTVLKHTGLALMGSAEASGQQRLLRATQAAAASPLLEGIHINGARAMLVNFRAGRNLGLRELSEAMLWLREQAHPDANVIFGSVVDDDLGDRVRATIIATGFEAQPAARRPRSNWIDQAIADSRAQRQNSSFTRPPTPVPPKRNGDF